MILPKVVGIIKRAVTANFRNVSQTLYWNEGLFSSATGA